jgi:hypothetical protein
MLKGEVIVIAVLIGGPNDGERVEVNDKREVIQMLAPVTDDEYGDRVISRDGPEEFSVYLRTELAENLAVFALEGMSLDEVTRVMIEGYRR